jgi:glutamate-5-semialdehyde dehydrogenase
MSSTLTTVSSTHDKLLHARDAAARLAQLSTAQKNTILLAMADALLASEKGILEANREDLETCGLTGSMRDRLC